MEAHQGVIPACCVTGICPPCLHFTVPRAWSGSLLSPANVGLGALHFMRSWTRAYEVLQHVCLSASPCFPAYLPGCLAWHAHKP
jgi:hypothetical protein